MALVAMVFATGCKKDPDNGNGNNTQNHKYVDLGLPSGTLWATCNIGASTPEAYGNFYAWGETQSKEVYDWSAYKYANGDWTKLTRYCQFADLGDNGYTDTLTVLLPEDDAATTVWGSDWKTPSLEQWKELFANTNNEWVEQEGVYGYLFKATNGESIFLPGAGLYRESSHDGIGDSGFYLSATISTISRYANISHFTSNSNNIPVQERAFGYSLRPVRSSK